MRGPLPTLKAPGDSGSVVVDDDDEEEDDEEEEESCRSRLESCARALRVSCVVSTKQCTRAATTTVATATAP